MVKKIMTHIRYPVLVVGIVFCLVGVAYAATSNIDPTKKWAWSKNVGWVNFAPVGYEGVTVYADHLEGYAWAENIGWMRLGSYDGGDAHTYANDAADTYGVNRDPSGKLSGYAWCKNVGWIKFDPPNGGVTIDPDTGSFDGYAWAENVGWMRFKNGDPAYNVVTAFRDHVETATGTGTVMFESDKGAIGNLVGVAEETLPCPEEDKPNLDFVHGFFSFDITGFTGNPVVVTITLPADVPVGAQYWKCQNGQWIQIPLGSDDGDNVIAITLIDGGLGDGDGNPVPDGVIQDPGGVGLLRTVVGGHTEPLRALHGSLLALVAAVVAGAIAAAALKRRAA